MRRLLSVAPIVVLTIAWVAQPVCAQRGGSRGGFSGGSGASFHGGSTNSGPAFRGGSSRPPSGGFASAPRSGLAPSPRYGFQAPRPVRPLTNGLRSNGFNPYPRSVAGRTRATVPNFARTGLGNSFARSNSADGSGHRMPYRPPYRRDHNFGWDNFPAGVVWPYWNYGLLGYPGFLVTSPIGTTTIRPSHRAMSPRTIITSLQTSSRRRSPPGLPCTLPKTLLSRLRLRS